MPTPNINAGHAPAMLVMVSDEARLMDRADMANAANGDQAANAGPASTPAAGRSFRGLLYTGAPATPMFSDTAYIYDLDGFQPPKRTQVPLLYQHGFAPSGEEPEIGIVDAFTVTPAGLVVEGRYLASSGLAQRVQARHEEGFHYAMSAGVDAEPDAIETLAEGAVAVVNGRTVQGPLNIVRRWTICEGSVCSVGADRRAGMEALLSAARPPQPPRPHQHHPSNAPTPNAGGPAMAQPLSKRAKKNAPENTNATPAAPAPLANAAGTDDATDTAAAARANEDGVTLNGSGYDDAAPDTMANAEADKAGDERDGLEAHPTEDVAEGEAPAEPEHAMSVDDIIAAIAQLPEADRSAIAAAIGHDGDAEAAEPSDAAETVAQTTSNAASAAELSDLATARLSGLPTALVLGQIKRAGEAGLTAPMAEQIFAATAEAFALGRGLGPAAAGNPPVPERPAHGRQAMSAAANAMDFLGDLEQPARQAWDGDESIRRHWLGRVQRANPAATPEQAYRAFARTRGSRR